MTASSLSGLSTVLITLSLVAGCGSAKQIGYRTRPEQPTDSGSRFEVSISELDEIACPTIIFAHYQEQQLRPSRDYWLEVRYSGSDSIAMKSESVVISAPQFSDTLSVDIWESATTGYGLYDQATDRTYQASLLLAHITVFGSEPIDTINYSFELMLVHQDTTARLEGPIHFAGRAIKYRY